MNEKYLPIGSVCTLKGKNKKVMITGFYSVEFNGNLRINDYCGCAYPEGMLLPEAVCTFNHSDIDKVEFIGYEDNEQKKFKNLLKQLTDSTDDVHSDDWVLTSNKSYSKLLFDENGVVVLAEPVPEKKNVEKIHFDKNGIVVSVDEERTENPFYKNYDSASISDGVKVNNDIFKNEELSGTEDLEQQKNSLNKIEFDENGIVIGVKEEKPKEQYRFDENGILISVVSEEAENLDDIPPIGPGLPGYIQPQNKVSSKYKFDENGLIISQENYEFDPSGNLVSVNNSTIEDKIPPIGPGLPGYIQPQNKVSSKYKFDENGLIISQENYEFDPSGNLVSVNNSTIEDKIPAIGPGLPGYESTNKGEEKEVSETDDSK